MSTAEAAPEVETDLPDPDLPDADASHAACARCYPRATLGNFDVYVAICGRKAMVRKGMTTPFCEDCKALMPTGGPCPNGHYWTWVQ